MTPPRIGYCTNVHAGRSFDDMRDQLDDHARAVRVKARGDRPLDIGLWLSNSALRDVKDDTDELDRFGGWLRDRNLRVMTFNGFPYGDFHAGRVKHDVYTPDWTETARFRYTSDLALLASVICEQDDISISTLPLRWRADTDNATDDRIVGQLAQLAASLASLEQTTGKLVHVDLEPEPGCALDRAEHVVEFFRRHLDPAGDPAVIRRHIGVCHDICHSAVMHEPQADAIRAYTDAGIRIGKIQVSSAMELSVAAPADADVLRPFAEDRYLHQTVVAHDGHEAFFEDLPLALGARPAGNWRTHYHLPIFLDHLDTSLGRIDTTRRQIGECLRGVHAAGLTPDLEIETYTWSILPDEMRPPDLAGGIAHEIRWLDDLVETIWTS